MCTTAQSLNRVSSDSGTLLQTGNATAVALTLNLNLNKKAFWGSWESVILLLLMWQKGVLKVYDLMYKEKVTALVTCSCSFTLSVYIEGLNLTSMAFLFGVIKNARQSTERRCAVISLPCLNLASHFLTVLWKGAPSSSKSPCWHLQLSNNQHRNTTKLLISDFLHNQSKNSLICMKQKLYNSSPSSSGHELVKHPSVTYCSNILSNISPKKPGSDQKCLK